MLQNTEKHRNYHENRHQFLGQMCQSTEKYENFHEKWTWKKLNRRKRQKNTSFIVKTALKNIPEQRKVRELPRKMNIEEVEEPETTKIHIQNEHASTKARK